MHRHLPMRGPVFIESFGVIFTRGAVEWVEPATRRSIDEWPDREPTIEPAPLHVLRYPGGGLHSPDTVALCRRLAASDPGGDVTLIYAHRSSRYQQRTPLLQSLLAALRGRLRVHGIRVEHGSLPLDPVLLAIAALRECHRCLVIKDNAIRVDGSVLRPVTSIQYLVLSRATGSWKIDGIVFTDAAASLTRATDPDSLDAFLLGSSRDAESLSLSSPLTHGGVGLVNISRVSRPRARAARTRIHAPALASSSVHQPRCEYEREENTDA
jgi:hypothetical protein